MAALALLAIPSAAQDNCGIYLLQPSTQQTNGTMSVSVAAYSDCHNPVTSIDLSVQVPSGTRNSGYGSGAAYATASASISTTNETGYAQYWGDADTYDNCWEVSGDSEPYSYSVLINNPAPVSSSISPPKALVGTPVSVTLNGTGFSEGATIQAGPSITVSNLSVSSSTNVTATFTIQNSSDASGNWNITITNPDGKVSNGTNFYVQIPTSLTVLSVQTIANGANGGCLSTEFGIRVSVKYQVVDQNAPAVAIQSGAMIPQESVNGSGYADIGPSTGFMATEYTNSDGTYTDGPVGICSASSFSLSVTQAVQIAVGSSAYGVRTNSFTVTGSASGHGSITNNLDISGTR